MRGLAIRLGGVLVSLAIASQFLLPPYLEDRIAGRLTAHGGTAQVSLSAIPAARLLFGDGQDLSVRARGLSFAVPRRSKDVFKQLDGFKRVTIAISDSQAGPFIVRSFWLERRAEHRFVLLVAADATAGDVARYAGAQLAGDFGQALAGLASSALGGFDRPVPVNARMEIDTSGDPPQAINVQGDVAGLPAGPLAQVVANALLSTL
jgi:hypothetical protein